MTTPVYDGMPPTERTFAVPMAAGGFWPGRIICGGACRDDYARIVIAHYDGWYLKLQRTALASWKAAEEALGFPIHVTGTWRSCADQTRLYRSDRSRYAPPSSSAHCRGLAADVSTVMPRFTQAIAALEQRGWHRARPEGEPWHVSFGIQV